MPIVSPTSSNAQFTLEKIRDSFRQHLAKISPEFTFGRYTSVHSIFEQILKTQATAPVIVADITCPNGHNVDRNRSPTCNGEVIVFGRPGLSLRACLDDFVLTLHARCPTCGSYLSCTSTFAQTPPLLAFDLGNNFDSTIPMDPVLEINCQGSLHSQRSSVPCQ